MIASELPLGTILISKTGTIVWLVVAPTPDERKDGLIGLIHLCTKGHERKFSYHRAHMSANSVIDNVFTPMDMHEVLVKGFFSEV